MADSDSGGESQSAVSSRRSGPIMRVFGGVIAILSGILYFVIAIITLLQGPGSSLTFANIAAIWLPVTLMFSSGALLSVGGIMMFRRTGGHGLVIAGCVLILALAVLGFVSGVLYKVSFEPMPGVALDEPLVTARKISSTLAFMAPAIVTLLLALLNRAKVIPGSVSRIG